MTSRPHRQIQIPTDQENRVVDCIFQRAPFLELTLITSTNRHMTSQLVITSPSSGWLYIIPINVISLSLSISDSQLTPDFSSGMHPNQTPICDVLLRIELSLGNSSFVPPMAWLVLRDA
jgi:hypothetical protein